MLTISKPTLFSPDGLAARGQCNKDSPGWQLRWFDRDAPPLPVWQGAYKTCRHLQMNCVGASTLDQVKQRIEELLNASSLSPAGNQPTDAYPAATRAEKPQDSAGAKKKRRKKRH